MTHKYVQTNDSKYLFCEMQQKIRYFEKKFSNQDIHFQAFPLFKAQQL